VSNRCPRVANIQESGLSKSEKGRVSDSGAKKIRQITSIKKPRKQIDPVVEMPLSTGDVAKMLNIHTNTVRRWCRSGMLKAYRIGSRGDRRFIRRDVIKLLQES
jgi:excisionase family DNA binding protein